jgi:hypothetical protein
MPSPKFLIAIISLALIAGVLQGLLKVLLFNIYGVAFMLVIVVIIFYQFRKS